MSKWFLWHEQIRLKMSFSDNNQDCKHRSSFVKVRVSVCLGRPLWQWPRSFDWFVKSLKSQLVNKRLDVVSTEFEDKPKISLIIRYPHTYIHTDTHLISSISAQRYSHKHCLIFSPTYLLDIFLWTWPRCNIKGETIWLLTHLCPNQFFVPVAPLKKNNVIGAGLMHH